MCMCVCASVLDPSPQKKALGCEEAPVPMGGRASVLMCERI